MKVPPKRKGNCCVVLCDDFPGFGPSMKVPPKRKGNHACSRAVLLPISLNESPSEKEGKSSVEDIVAGVVSALNESPSEKEGKFLSMRA